ncbi:translation initiation factor Sui1 [Variovorax ginsengisoli]|uniref:Translation initiation factor 1 n=1 Tax=Variovorax ginsengisoli TaxID=363844 RepID=A0ABT9SCH4_9BURK|nr:translation initiation factor Sui1 [Variovorax ginsengisoli]MDP9902050.1 translation initiation factor 1 [Variovorax ginsengisoli]
MKMGTEGSRLVYSTDTGRICPDCGQPKAACICKQAKAAAPTGDGVVRVSYETKGRKGKGVTVVRGVLLDDKALTLLGKQLKSGCGSGGTTKDGVIEIQGDHREFVIAALQKQGLTVKRAGG